MAYSEEGRELGFIDLFSSEPYSTSKYVSEQLTDQVSKIMFLDGGQAYFGISPPFIQRSMNGRFSNTLIIMMGCNGLTYKSLAKAFVEKGAKAYISWDKGVSASHTDAATMHLLQHFLIEKRTLEQSVQETFKNVGFDPTYKSLLLYYPLEAGDYTIQNIVGKLVTNNVEIQHKVLSEKRKITNHQVWV